MNNSHATYIAKHIVANLLEQVKQKLKIKQILTNVPLFVMGDFDGLLSQTIKGAAMQADRRGFYNQQNLESILKPGKDTLMPKDLSQQKVKSSSPKCLSPRSSCSSKKKSPKLSRRQSSKIESKLKSISFSGTQKNDPKYTNSFNQLQLNNQESEELFDQMRQKAEARLRKVEDEKKLKDNQEKQHKAKIQQFKEITKNGHPDYTFDYGGDTLRRTMRDGKVRINSVSSRIGSTSKKLKEGFNKINLPEEYRIESSSKRIKDNTEQSFYLSKKQEIPLFPQKADEGFNPKTLKLEQYTKFYGHKYSRLGVNTIQVVEMAKTSREDFFGQKKHLKEDQMPTTTQKNFHKEGNSRRIALPKLHGKYKVLDRYQD